MTLQETVMASKRNGASQPFFEPEIPAGRVSSEPAKTVSLRSKLSDWCKAAKPTAEIMTITPELARLMLERNREENRPQSRRPLWMYQKEIAEERMMVTNQGLGFDTEGRLIDGQHRLVSCIQAGKPFDSVVVFGLDPEAFMFVDSGYKRTSGHKLHMDGFKDTNKLAAASRIVLMHDLLGIRLSVKDASWGISPRGDGNQRIPDEFIIDFCRETPKFVELQKWYHSYSKFRPIPQSSFHAVHWLIWQKHPSLANAFIEQLCYGESLNRAENVYRVREHLRALHLSRERLNQAWILTWLIDSFNDTRRGKTTKFTMVSGRDFPKVLS